MAPGERAPRASPVGNPTSDCADHPARAVAAASGRSGPTWIEPAGPGQEVEDPEDDEPEEDPDELLDPVEEDPEPEDDDADEVEDDEPPVELEPDVEPDPEEVDAVEDDSEDFAGVEAGIFDFEAALLSVR